MSDELLKQGIRSAQAGNLPLAQAYLIQMVRQAPDSAQAWYWLGKVINDPEKQNYCLERARQLGLQENGEASLTTGDAGLSITEATVPENHPETTEAAAAPVQLPNKILTSPVASPDSLETGSTRAQPSSRTRGLSLLLLMSGAGVLVLIAVFSMLLHFYQQPGVQVSLANPPQAGQPDPGLAPPAGRVLPTLYPSETPRPVLSRTPSPAPSHTPTQDPAQLYKLLGFQITAAREALRKEQSAECIRAYDNLLESMPNWPVGYFNRGVCKRQASLKTHSLDEYINYLNSAITDQDQFIYLNPTDGDAYVERALDYMGLREGLDNMAEEALALDIANENLQAALALNTTHPSAQINRAILPILMDNCQKGLEEGLNQLDITDSGQPMSTLYEVIASAHLCLGQYSQARTYIDKSLAIKYAISTNIYQTAILIGSGEYDQALDAINQSIKIKPTFTGYRFYLRALIYYDRGDIDLAREDLLTGDRYTWYHRGLYAYLMGMLALRDGDRAEGINWLQYAGASMHPNEGLWLKERILKELNRLGAPQISPTPAAHWDVTPIVAPTLASAGY